MNTYLLSLRKKVGKEPFNNGFVLLLIICRDPRGKFFAKLSAKESGKKVGKEPFDSLVCATIYCLHKQNHYIVGRGLAPAAPKNSQLCTNFHSLVIPSEVEESPYKQICTNGDFSIPLPLVAPLEMTIIDYFYNFFVTLLESTNQSTPRALPALEMTT